MIKRMLLGLALALCAPLMALAQTSPGLVYGQVPTAAQWNSYFAAKQDYSAAAVVGPGTATAGNLVKWGTYPNVVDGGAPPTFIAGTGIAKTGTASCVGGCTFSVTGGGVTTFSAGTTGFTPSSATSGAVTLAGTLNLANGGTGATTAGAARTALGLGTAATQNTGTSGANVPLTNGNNVWAAQRSTLTTLTPSGSTFTPNFDTGQDFYVSLTAAGMTFANPSTTPVAGQKGVIFFQQDATGSRTVTTWGSSYKCPNACSTNTFTTTASRIDAYTYAVINSTTIVLTPAATNVF